MLVRSPCVQEWIASVKGVLHPFLLAPAGQFATLPIVLSIPRALS